MARTEGQRAERWRSAFALQAASDRDVHDLLTTQGVSECHRLHFLQMHLEKLAKAFLCDASPTDTEVARIQRTHEHIEAVLPRIIIHNWSQTSEAKRPRGEELKRLRRLCRELDLLAPSIDNAGDRGDNCESPWAAMESGQPVVIAPCQHMFPVTRRLHSRDGITLLKVARHACNELLNSKSIS